ncbi:MAG: hypothetical protein ABW167_20645 [Baekduia sp.]
MWGVLDPELLSSGSQVVNTRKDEQMPTAPRKKDDDQPAEAAEAAVEAQREVDPPEEAERFDHAFLTEAAGSFGYQPFEVAGALSAVSKKNLTIDEAAAATKAWLKAPVKTDTVEA